MKRLNLINKRCDQNLINLDKQSNKPSILLNDIQLPQQLSKCIQDAYEKADENLKQIIFEQDIENNIIEFCLDKYNHYIILNILEKGIEKHKKLIYDIIIKYTEMLCYKKYSYKIIQSCLINMNNKNQSLINYLVNHIKKLQFDQYGNLIIGTLLLITEQDELLAKIIGKLAIDKLKYHQYGCVILIQLVTCKNSIVFQQIINDLIRESQILSKSQYSNYIIQKMLKDCSIEQCKSLINDHLIPNFVDLSCDKFGSNVCEIMVKQSMAYQLQNLWNFIICNNLKFLVNDEFANYVMQTYYSHIIMFNYIKEEFQQQLLELNKQQLLNSNGKIVYRFVIQCNQLVQ